MHKPRRSRQHNCVQRTRRMFVGAGSLMFKVSGMNIAFLKKHRIQYDERYLWD